MGNNIYGPFTVVSEDFNVDCTKLNGGPYGSDPVGFLNALCDAVNTSATDIVGTANQVTVSETDGVFTLSLPSPIVRNLTGNVTGNVTGNCSGSAATVTGAAQTAITSVGTLTSLTVSGGITGDLTGNVTGNCSGTAATVTGAAQTAITSVGTLTSLAVGPVTGSAGITSSSATAGIGYAPGAGGAVTQDTSRTTTVVINNVSGAITLFSDAGSATPFVFTVTNSAVAATDTISVSQKSGTDAYAVHVVNVAAGSFQLCVVDLTGTTTEQPVINFNVIKGVAA